MLPNTSVQATVQHLRIIVALAFIPPGKVAIALERLYEVICNTYGIATDAVLDYFEITNIGTFCRNAARGVPLFSIDMWNMLHCTRQEMSWITVTKRDGFEDFSHYVFHITLHFANLFSYWNHTHKKQKDGLESSLDGVLFAAEI